MAFEDLEQNGSAYADEPRPLDIAIEQLHRVIHDKAETEPKPSMRAEFALLDEAFDIDEIQLPLQVMYGYRPTMTPLYGAQFLVRNIRFIEHIAGSPAEDVPTLRELLAENSITFRRNLIIREITSTKGYRSSVTAVALRACGIEGYSLVDFGVGQNHNLNMLALAPSEDFHYPPVAVGRLAVAGTKESNGDPKNQDVISDPEQSAAFNEALNDRPSGLKYGLGIDQNDPYDIDNEIWSRVCSINADETDAAAIEEFRQLSAARPKNVGVMSSIDFSHPLEDYQFMDRKRSMLPEAPDSYEAALFSFSTYQLKGRTEVQQAMKNAEALAEKTFVLDAVTISRNGRWHFHDNRRPNAIALYMRDNTRLETGFKKLVTASDGRIAKVVIEPAFGELPLAKEMGLMPLKSPPRANRVHPKKTG